MHVRLLYSGAAKCAHEEFFSNVIIMPKVSDKKKGAAKGKKVPWKSERTEEEERETAPSTVQSDPQSDPADSDVESTTSVAGITEGQEELIADFFENRPFFYDKGDSRYKNTKAKDAELLEFSKVVGLGREYQFIVSIITLLVSSCQVVPTRIGII